MTMQIPIDTPFFVVFLFCFLTGSIICFFLFLQFGNLRQTFFSQCVKQRICPDRFTRQGALRPRDKC